jgi:hypothetical protein
MKVSLNIFKMLDDISHYILSVLVFNINILTDRVIQVGLARDFFDLNGLTNATTTRGDAKRTILIAEINVKPT